MAEQPEHEHEPAGPSFQTYVETRFALLIESIKSKATAQDVAILSLAESTRSAAAALKAASDAAQVATDLRYQQRFEAQSDALNAAFQSQQQAMQCVSADTPVLCADLVWRPAGELEVGEELVAFDELAANRQGRRFRKAVVTANALREDTLLLVTTPVGSVKCNREHPWLVRRPDKNARWRWIKAADMLVGDEVLHALDIWESEETWEAGWLAGMYDGEGCLRIIEEGGVRLLLTQQEGDTADRVHDVLTERLGREPCFRQQIAGKYNNNETVNCYEVNRRADVLKLLGSLRPMRLLRRSDEAWDGRYLCGTGRSATVTDITDAGSGTIASLSTSTYTYIAGGFAMHNTAFTVAEKAVQAALAAADRAVSKAELAADKRFEALNELRQMLNDMVSTLITRVEALQRFDGITDKIDAATRRYEGLEARFNTMSGEITGGERRGSGVKTNVGMIVGIVGGGVGLMLLLIALARYLGGR
jgi:hypothetical protein